MLTGDRLRASFGGDLSEPPLAASCEAPRSPGLLRATNLVLPVVIPIGALLFAMVLFAAFIFASGASPIRAYQLMYRAAFGSWFAWQDSLQRAAPILLTALCTALPARVGLIVVGNEGALVLGGLGAVAAALALADMPPLAVQLAMLLAGFAVGGLWIGAVGALRHYRGVNEVISSLMMVYIATAVFNHVIEGPLRGPSAHRAATPHIGEDAMMGSIPGTSVHWGFAIGVAFCVAAYLLFHHTTIGFSAKVISGNIRAAALSSLPIGRLILLATALGGGAAGLAGAIEVAAVHGVATTSLISGYGFTGILIAFVARQNPLAIIPVAILLGGIGAGGGLLQRQLEISSASVLVLQGLIFLSILASETLYGRWQPTTIR